LTLKSKTVLATIWGHYFELSIRPVGVPPELASALATEPHVHVLEFVRQYIDQSGQLFEVAVSIHPADRFDYSIFDPAVAAQRVTNRPRRIRPHSNYAAARPTSPVADRG
jgi:hypothetical protein